MNSQQLINLIEIRKCRSMSEASQNLHLTPQALSISMHNLEKELGFSILTTTFSGTKLTEKGELFAELSEKYLADISQLKEEQLKTGPLEPFLFPALSGVCSMYLSDFNNYLKQLGVKQTVSFSSYSPEKMIQKIHKNDIPYGITYQSYLKNTPLINFQDCDFYKINKVKISVVLHKEHPLTKYKKVSLKSLIKYTWVNVANADFIFDALFDKIGRTTSVDIVPTLDLLPAYFSNNKSAVLLTHSNSNYLKNDNNFVSIDLNDDFTTAIGILYNKTNHFSDTQKKQLKYIVEFFRLQFS